MYAAGIAIPCIIAISLIQKITRPSLKELIAGIRSGVEMGGQIAIVIAVVGIIAQTIITTNLGPKVADFFMGLAGGQFILILFISMILCIILGAGVPSTAACTLIACCSGIVIVITTSAA